MKKFQEFLNEASIKKVEDDAYKDIKYDIGDKVFVRMYGGAIWSGEIFNRTLYYGYTYCIKFDKRNPNGNGCQFNLAEYPTKTDKDANSYWLPNQGNLVFSPEDKDADKYEYVYLKEIFGKERKRKKCNNPTQKKEKHTWNCKLCKGIGYIIPELSKNEFRDVLIDKEFIYQEYKTIEGFKPFYFDTSQFWSEYDEIEQIGGRPVYKQDGSVERVGGRTGIHNVVFNEEGRFKLRPKPKKAEDPYRDNWWFINSEKKPIKKKGE
jgi:hypothetical protein